MEGVAGWSAGDAYAKGGDRSMGLTDKASVFETLGRVFTGVDDTPVLSPDTDVTVALRHMVGHRLTALPVVENNHLRGVFSVWALLLHLETAPTVKLSDLQVYDLMESTAPVTVEDHIQGVLSRLERNEVIVLNSPHGLQGIVTPARMLAYFSRLTRPYVLLREIEFALRAILTGCLSDGLPAAAAAALTTKYTRQGRSTPERLQEMEFSDYGNIITNEQLWPRFRGVMGNNRKLVLSRFSALAKLRNSVFHFRDDLSLSEFDRLARDRDWMLAALERMAATEALNA
jgi:CBS domain-containing protein